MLTAEHVRARRRGDELHLRELDGKTRERVLPIARAYVVAARGAVGDTRARLSARLDAIPVTARDKKIADGLRKLVDDGCDFEAECPIDPLELRAAVFERAARERRASAELDRGAVLSAVAADLDLDPTTIEQALYADLRDEHVLREVVAPEPERLVDLYERGQAQAVMLRAERVVARVRGTPDQYRTLFRALKFRRLLHVLEPEAGGGYRVAIDGPLSLFSSVTKYGLALALTLPTIQACDRWTVDADVRWGPKRQRLRLHLEGRGAEAGGGAALPTEVERLRTRIAALDVPFTVELADDLLELPGQGLCVPDLRFVHAETGEVAWLEVMGFWSRDAVWRRVELVQAGLAHKLVFAISKRLRVSEAVLDDESPACLYVYKGAMSAKLVAERVTALFER